jgi:hypothetical protein
MTTLRDQLTSHLDATVAPPADLPAVLRRGRRLRRRRTAVVTSAAAVAALAGGGLALSTRGPATPDPDLPTFAATGQAEVRSGLRAYAMPGRELHMADRTFPADALDFLDTDAAATPEGIVSYDRGLPVLLEPSGSTVLLDVGPTDQPGGFHPTAKADAEGVHVAYALIRDESVTVKVSDLDQRTVVATARVPCREACSSTVIDGLDSGTVFVRDHEGTLMWDYRTDQWSHLAGPRTRVADVRNRVVLYAGSAPGSPVEGWRYVPGAVDAQLSYDGSHVLDWSAVLQPTRPGGTPWILDKGPTKPGYAFFTFDTDGSVLVAVGPAHSGGDFAVYDCPLPSGRCDALDPLAPGSGDPMFVGDDM